MFSKDQADMPDVTSSFKRPNWLPPDFDWDEARQSVNDESRGRIVITGLTNAGKSSVLNRLCGWMVSTPTHQGQEPSANGTLTHRETAVAEADLHRTHPVPGAHQPPTGYPRQPEPARTGEEAWVDQLDLDLPTTHDWLEDFGLFCLVDLPHKTEAGYGHDDLPLSTLTPLDLIAEADLVVYVLDGLAQSQALDYGWLGKIRRLGVPLVVALNKVDLLGSDSVVRQAEIEGRLATTIVPISTVVGDSVLDTLLPRMVDTVPALAVPLGRELQRFRRQMADRLIRKAALFNGLVAMEPVPFLDIPIQLITLVKLTMQIATLYDQPTTDSQRREVIVVVSGGLLGRYAAQQLVKVIPVVGWLVSSSVAMGATWLLGQTAVSYFEAGGDAAVTDRWRKTKLSLRQYWSLATTLWRKPGDKQSS